MAKINLHKNDLPNDFSTSSGFVSVDTETMGLIIPRDRLCTVQIFDGQETHIVHFTDPVNYEAPNLKKLLQDEKIVKIFHYARFDLAVIYYYVGVMCQNIYCTKIASKLTRTNSNAHSLSTLCKEILGVSLQKQEQCSNWGAKELTKEQLNYAKDDVLYLHLIKEELDKRLKQSKRQELMGEIMHFLPSVVELDMQFFNVGDVFAH